MSAGTDRGALPDDDRAITAQIGFILLFGIVVILLAVWQAQVVPAENAEVEFDHYQAVQTDLLELRSDYIDAAETGTTRSATVQLGTQYPTRVFFVNGPPPQGRLTTRTVSNGTITADGVDLARVCGLDGPVKTRSLVLDTAYNELADSETPPYRYENTVLYRQTAEGVVYESNQSLVQGSTLNLFPLTSNVSKSGIDAASVDFSGAETGEVAVDGPLNVTIPTALSATQWEQLLAAEPNFEDVRNATADRVTIELSDTRWTVRCAAVGAERTPAVTDPPDAAPPGGGGGGEGGGGVGSGSVSDYSAGTTGDTFSVPNGRWTNITCTDQLLLSDAKPARRPNGDDLQGDVVRFAGSLNNSLGDVYTIDVRLARANDGSWNTKKVYITGDGNNQNAELDSDAARRIYEGGETDLLELSNYDKGRDSDWAQFLREIRDLEDTPPVSWQTTRIVGRVGVALVCDPPPQPPASGVSVIDGSTPRDGSPAIRFDLQVASDTTKTITAFKITTPGNQNSNARSATALRRDGSGNPREVRLPVSNTDGANRSGGLNRNNLKLDGTQYSLDRSGNKGSEATFSDGAIINVDMGDVRIDGDATWTYELADSESKADVVVTFYFDDGTRFQVYLRVTNVNS